MAQRTAIPAWMLWTASLVASTAAMTFAVLDRSNCTSTACESLRDTNDLPSVSGLVGLLLFLAVTATVGWLVASQRRSHPIGWLLLAFALVWTGGQAARGYALHGLAIDPGSLPAARVAHGVARFTEGPASFAPLVYVLLLFPSGAFRSRRWRWLGVAFGVASAIVLLSDGLSPDTDAPYGSNPLAVPAVADALEIFELPAVLLMVVGVLGAMGSPVVRFRAASADERQALKWVVAAAVVVAVTLAAAPIFFTVPALATAWFVVFPVAGATLPAAMGIAILRRHLYDIDFILNRTLLYASLSVVLVLVYFAVVSGVGLVLDAGGTAPAVAATAIAAILAQPIRRRLQRVINRLTFGDRDEPYAIVSRLGRRVEAAAEPDAVLGAVVDTVAEALRLPYAAIALSGGAESDGLLRTAAEHGHAPGDTVEFPLVYQGATVGVLVVGLRSPGEPLTPKDTAVLADLARHAGVAAHAVTLTSQLKVSRARAVRAREEERRRIRRDIHDGLGPSLAAISLGLQTADRTYARSPDAGAELLDKLARELTAAVDETRRLVYDLRPPVLDQLGLGEAIRQEARRLEAASDNLTVDVDIAESLPPVPAAVEVAALRIASEALHNVVRHARANLCAVRIRIDDDHLCLDVSDNGVGIPDDYTAGVGLRAMAERVAELEGTFGFEHRTRDLGGARIVVTLPIGDL